MQRKAVQALDMELGEQIDTRVELNRLANKLSDAEAKIKTLESTVHYIQQYSAKQDNEQRFTLIQQEINYLKGTIAPMELYNKMNEVIDKVRELDGFIHSEIAEQRLWREKNYFSVVTYEDMVAMYKLASMQLKDLAPLLNCDVSTASRIVSGERAKDDYITYHRIKVACIDKINKEQAKK